MSQTISSTQNPKIKEVLKLSKHNYRDSQRLTVVEGGREVGLALTCGVTPSSVFVCPPLLDEISVVAAHSCEELETQGYTHLYEVTPEVYGKLAYRSSTSGLLAVIPHVSHTLDDIEVGSCPLLLVVEGAEKPGNLGAILRTADAAGVDAVIVCGEGTDIHNPNAIRASLGAVFALNVVVAETADVVAWLRENGIRSLAASPAASVPHNGADMSGAVAIVVGSEAYGLTQTWMDEADELVKIPMFGRVDSLNLSASAAILLYEAVRQRVITT